MKIDLGCGTRPVEGAIGVDGNPATGAAVIHDLDTFPYPFEDGVADEVHLDNVLEHLDDVLAVLGEVHRICRSGAAVHVHVPYFRSRWSAIDPTHRHQFTVQSFDYLDPASPLHDRYRYTEATFTVESVRFNERFPARGVSAAVARFANRRPELYESRFSHLFPLDELHVVLRRR